MNIYISIELKKRELSSRLLLALEAAKRGHDVYLGEVTPYLNRNIFEPGIVHLKSLTPTSQRISQLKEFKNKNFFCTSQDEESGHTNDDPKQYINLRYGKKTIELSEKIFTWGKFDYHNLIKEYSKFKKKFSNTGNPRIDFWKEKNKGYFNKNSIHLKDFILVSSNFETICGHRNLPNTIAWLRDLGYFGRGLTEEGIIERASKEHLIFDDFVKLIKKVSTTFPRKKIVFRPHPIEKVSDWKKIFFSYKNILVDNSNGIADWITNSSLVIHNGCTGGLEAALRNKNVISFSPKGLNIGHKLSNLVSQNFTNIDDAIKGIKKSFQKKSKNKYEKKKEKVKKRFENYYNLDAYLSIVNEWEKINKKDLNNKNNINKVRVFSKLKEIKSNFKKNKKGSYKFSSFTPYEIGILHKKISKIDKNFEDIKIDKISGKLLRIYKRI